MESQATKKSRISTPQPLPGKLWADEILEDESSTYTNDTTLIDLEDYPYTANDDLYVDHPFSSGSAEKDPECRSLHTTGN